MVDATTLGGYAGWTLFAVVCLAALVVGARLLWRERDRGPARWLGLHLVATVALVALAVGGEAAGLDEPAGGLGDRLYLTALALGGGAFLLHLPLARSYPREGNAREDGWLAWLPWIAPAFGALYVLLAWPGPSPVPAGQTNGDLEAMRAREAWFNHYDVLEDGAAWLVVACLVLGVLVVLGTLAYRALTGSRPVANRARRMLAQAMVAPAVWLTASGLLTLLILPEPGGPLASVASFGFEALWDNGVPFALVMVGPILWGLDLLQGDPLASGDASIVEDPGLTA